jgi:hypothetical protein
MQSSSILKLVVSACLVCALVIPAFAPDRAAVSAPMASVIGNLSDFYTTGNAGRLDIEKGGTTMEFSFGGNLMINGKPWTSWGMTTEDGGGSIPSVLKLHCTLVRVYYNGRVATALKTISNGGSRFFC